MQLSAYLTQVQRLLHDTQGKIYNPVTELPDYITSASAKVVSDTGCLRSIVAQNLVAQQETYSFPTVTVGANNQPVVDCLNVSVINGSQRYAMRYLPWTEFNARIRAQVGYYAFPYFFSFYGQNTVYLGVIPDSAYAAEFDLVYKPITLVNPTDDDSVSYPYNDGVQYYATYLALLSRWRYDEADKFKSRYEERMNEIISETNNRRIRNPY